MKRHSATRFSSLYMDCNSIIYDCVRTLERTVASVDSTFESQLIDSVIAKIEYYVSVIKPSNVLHIAFDGVAPFAKMEQQRVRRYKTGYLASVQSSSNSEMSTKWNTSAITPGTNFMNVLSSKVRRTFVESGRGFGARTVIVSASDEAGEGEHKMFQYMRENALQNETIAVYGLDSDLIMLSLFHCFACENIHIFRESPAFGKALLNGTIDDNELIFLDNRALAGAILKEMGIGATETGHARSRIYDYIFMCFLLGNDFLPHFPALNIRTHGNFTLLETYQRVIGTRPDRFFISAESGNIQWRWVKLFLRELAKQEHRCISEEYNSRAKLEARHYPTDTKEDREIAFDNIPVIYRSEEHYVNPKEKGWESRYYRVAFHLDKEPDKEFVQSVCQNYLEGLEWVFKYYTEGCPHWRWRYAFHYPPLFSDLINYVPDFETEFITGKEGINRPFQQQTQLAYVIPKWNHHLLSKKMRAIIDENGVNGCYEKCSDLTFQWMFCRYFWESHAILKEIPFHELENMDRTLLI